MVAVKMDPKLMGRIGLWSLFGEIQCPIKHFKDIGLHKTDTDRADYIEHRVIEFKRGFENDEHFYRCARPEVLLELRALNCEWSNINNKLGLLANPMKGW